MRKPERLDLFYEELKEIHKRSFPDMRFGQFILNALGWVSQTKGRDPFFPEEDEMLNLIKEYANSSGLMFEKGKFSIRFSEKSISISANVTNILGIQF